MIDRYDLAASLARYVALLIACLLLALYVGVVRAQAQTTQANMAWVPNSAASSARWNGAWRIVNPNSLVLCGATAASNVQSAPIVIFQNCSTFVFGCAAAIRITPPITDGCPPPGYTQERFLPRSTIAGAPSACPPKPADETRPQVCPAGTLGQWTQTRIYASAPAPACWTAGEWLPTSPPPGSCPPIPQLHIEYLRTVPTTRLNVGDTFRLEWKAHAVDGCTMDNVPTAVEGYREGPLAPTDFDWITFTLVCQQQGTAVTQTVRVNIRHEAICYPLSDVPPIDWNPVTGLRFVWYGGELLPSGAIARWKCALPNGGVHWYCVGGRFDEFDEDADSVKDGDKTRKDQAWRNANWREFTPEEQAACDALKAAQGGP